MMDKKEYELFEMIVEINETYIGGKPRERRSVQKAQTRTEFVKNFHYWC
jgi:hypothetical protein